MAHYGVSGVISSQTRAEPRSTDPARPARLPIRSSGARCGSSPWSCSSDSYRSRRPLTSGRPRQGGAMLVNSRAPDYRFGRYVEPLTTASIISRFSARSTSRSWKTGLRCASPAKSPGRTRARNGQPGHAEGDRQQDRACQRGRERPGRISAPGFAADPLRHPRGEAGYHPGYGALEWQAHRHHAGDVDEHVAQLRPARAGREGRGHTRAYPDSRSRLTHNPALTGGKQDAA